MDVIHSNKAGGSDVTHVIDNDHKLAAEKYLEEKGFANEWEVVLPDEKMLMLDYDGMPFNNDNGGVGVLPELFFQTLGILEQIPGQGNQTYYTVTESKGGNTHCIVHLTNSMPIVERIAWQAAFGSDPKREALHLLSVAVGEINPILLFMRKSRTFTGVDERGENRMRCSHVELATDLKLLIAGAPREQRLLGDGNVAGQPDQGAR